MDPTAPRFLTSCAEEEEEEELNTAMSLKKYVSFGIWSPFYEYPFFFSQFFTKLPTLKHFFDLGHFSHCSTLQTLPDPTFRTVLEPLNSSIYVSEQGTVNRSRGNWAFEIVCQMFGRAQFFFLELFPFVGTRPKL